MTAEPDFAQLVTELHAALRDSLVSLLGQPANSPPHEYLRHTATGIEQAVDGYILLIQAGKTHAAQLVVRTCLESYFRIQAVWTKPELLFGIALYEHKQDLKFLKCAKVQGQDFVARSDALWQSLRQSLIDHFKAIGIKDHPLDAYGAAEAGGLKSVYEFQYRFFCNFTHASLRSVIGQIANLHSLSDRTILICLIGTLGAVSHIGARIPDLQEKIDRATVALDINPFGPREN